MKAGQLQLPPSSFCRGSAGFQRAGFTLIELMVALVLSSIVLAAIYGIYATHTRSFTTQNVSAEIQQEIRAAVDYMTEDLMMAGLDPLKSGQFGFTAATATGVQFSLDSDEDGSLDAGNAENINYAWAGTGSPLTQNGTIFINKVDTLSFTYLDLDGNTITSPGANLSDIRSVVLSIKVNEPAGRDGTISRTYGTRVRCRNIGLN